MSSSLFAAVVSLVILAPMFIAASAIMQSGLPSGPNLNLTTFVGGQQSEYEGFKDGNRSVAKFSSDMRDVTATLDGRALIVLDTFNFVIRHVDISTRITTTLAGQHGQQGLVDGSSALSAQFYRLEKGVLSRDGSTLYFTDYRSLRSLTFSSGTVVRTIAANISAYNVSKGFTPYYLKGLALNETSGSSGQEEDFQVALVTDYFHNRLLRVDLSSGATTNHVFDGTLRSLGDSGDGFGLQAKTHHPQAIVRGPNGVFYLAERAAIRRIDPVDLRVTRIGGTASELNTDGTVSNGQGSQWYIVTMCPTASFRTIYFPSVHVLRNFTFTRYDTMNGYMGDERIVDGVGRQARLNRAQGCALVNGTYLFFTDRYSVRVVKVQKEEVDVGPGASTTAPIDATTQLPASSGAMRTTTSPETQTTQPPPSPSTLSPVVFTPRSSSAAGTLSNEVAAAFFVVLLLLALAGF